ncbi:MAG: neutral zinc metallopeptidase [Pseudomonadota bacterium]|nr:neutral zinc metallopeptidase [Pseudomonadota bacterium]
MKWQGRRGSRNIVDRRRMSGGTAGIGGVGLLVILAIGYFAGIDVTPILNEVSQSQRGGGEVTEEDERAAQFVSVTLADTEEVWAGIFDRQVDGPYDPPTLVLYQNVTQSACGGASGATGPFYCPGDGSIYLDADFFVTMERQLGAGGDFAAAYVVAHEVAHSVQDQLGILSEANRLRSQSSQAQSNAISVRIELQADCFSGIWARQAEAQFGSLDPGDISEAMNAARQIGDDTLQRNAGRVPMPHTFTHGTSEQRQRWFATGYETGDLRACDTFNTQDL